MTTLQIATFGKGQQGGIVSGIRNFPIHELALICLDSDKHRADKFSREIEKTLGIPVTVNTVIFENVIRDTIERVHEILNLHGKVFQQVLINVSCGEKLISCAALSAAFINGIMAFGVDKTGRLVPMPVIKLSYTEIISEAKVKILRALDDLGDIVEGLDQLEQGSGFGKPLLSYHIQGSEESKGLVGLGLVEAKRGDMNKLSIKLTTLGKLFVSSKALDQK